MPRALCAAAPLLSAVVLFYLGPRERLGYDSFWHVFVARQDDWSQFWFEVADNAHPPLFYLVLKAATLIGWSPLVYRLPSIAAIVVAAALMCPIARRMVAHPYLPALAALMFGLSYSAIDMGLEVRAYALATCLTLAGLGSYLRLAETAFGEADARARTLFAGFMTLALLTHYSVAFVAAAAVLAPLGLAAADRGFRARLPAAWTRARLANVATFGVPLAVFAVFYAAHARRWVHRIQHVPEFMFDSRREGLLAFVARTTRDEIGVFTPHGPAGLVILAAAAAALVVALARRGRSDGDGRAVALLPPIMLIVMAGLTLAAAVAGRYPFGGPVRHQFFLLPFAVLTLAVILDRVGRVLPAGWPRHALVLVVAVGCAASIASWTAPFRATPGLMFQRQMAMFRASVPDARAIYLGQFSLIPFFMHHHEWDWRLRGPLGPADQFRVWTVSRDGRELFVCRDRAHWELDVADAELYANLDRCLDATGTFRVALFRVGPERLRQSREEGEALMKELAGKAGLEPRVIAIKRGNVFAEFERAPR